MMYINVIVTTYINLFVEFNILTQITHLQSKETLISSDTTQFLPA